MSVAAAVSRASGMQYRDAKIKPNPAVQVAYCGLHLTDQSTHEPDESQIERTQHDRCRAADPARMNSPAQPVLYQEAVSLALAAVGTELRDQDLDPLRYLVDIDAGLPLFAPRDIHQLRVAYNHRRELSMETSVPHEWLIASAGVDYDQFIAAVTDLVSALKTKVLESGRPL